MLIRILHAEYIQSATRFLYPINVVRAGPVSSRRSNQLQCQRIVQRCQRLPVMNTLTQSGIQRTRPLFHYPCIYDALT
ncbi:MAG: hypothetical protein EXR84_01180 [Gammaproteobacteria bacterium]|nr:hypothetical protein [Gammaproteobacteria bacterium]